MLLPRVAIDKGVHLLTYAPEVVVNGVLIAQLHIVDNAGQQVVREVTLLQIVELGKHQGANLFE